jgi:hypothetical protein
MSPVANPLPSWLGACSTTPSWQACYVEKIEAFDSAGKPIALKAEKKDKK